MREEEDEVRTNGENEKVRWGIYRRGENKGQCGNFGTVTVKVYYPFIDRYNASYGFRRKCTDSYKLSGKNVPRM